MHETFDLASSFEQLCRTESNSAWVIHDPEGLVRQIQILRQSHAEEIRQYTIRWYDERIQKLLELSRDGSIYSRIEFFRHAIWAGASLSVYLEYDLAAPKRRHMAQAMPAPLLEMLDNLMGLNPEPADLDYIKVSLDALPRLVDLFFTQYPGPRPRSPAPADVSTLLQIGSNKEALLKARRYFKWICQDVVWEQLGERDFGLFAQKMMPPTIVRFWKSLNGFNRPEDQLEIQLLDARKAWGVRCDISGRDAPLHVDL